MAEGARVLVNVGGELTVTISDVSFPMQLPFIPATLILLLIALMDMSTLMTLLVLLPVNPEGNVH